MRRTGSTAIAVMSIAAALAACSNGAETIHLTTTPSTGAANTTGSVTEWLGVLRTEPIASSLDDDTATVKAIVHGSIVASPVACFDGLPASIQPDVYLLGVVAPTKEELDQLLAKVEPTLGRSTIFEGRVRTMCLD